MSKLKFVHLVNIIDSILIKFLSSFPQNIKISVHIYNENCAYDDFFYMKTIKYLQIFQIERLFRTVCEVRYSFVYTIKSIYMNIHSTGDKYGKTRWFH